MKRDYIVQELQNIVGETCVLENEPMKCHTTFQVGGSVDYFITPHTIEEIKKCLGFLKKQQIPYYILGNGSNVLTSDEGYRGAILHMYHNMNHIELDGTLLRAQAGALLSKIAAKALDAELTGFEFASGIPGTIGGAVYMNAGAYGGEMKQVIESAAVMDQDGNVFTLGTDELKFGYRKSVVSQERYLVLEAKIRLSRGAKELIQSRMEELKELRVQKQPLKFGSAGSTFKRPKGYFAGKLIMDAGLSGYTIGGAQVSTKHCGFVVNTGGATAKNIVDLIAHIQKTVEEKYGVLLETEVKMLGEF